MNRNLNYEHVFNTVTESLATYVKKCHLETCILGISGGIDSTVVAAIAHKVSERTGVKLIGVSLMCNTNENDEITTADLVGNEFCDEYYKENIQEVYEVMSKFFIDSEATKHQSTPISEGNIKARIRMTYLWNLGGLRNGVVLDTDNMTEHNLGFWTIMGDSNYITPIGELWKTEVYKLAQYMFTNVYVGSEAIKQSMALVPTDGNGVAAGGDLAQIGGKSFDEVDDILYSWYSLCDSSKKFFMADGLTDSIKGTNFDVEKEGSKALRLERCKNDGVEFVPTLGDKYGVDLVRRIIKRSIASDFKRKKLPLVIDINSGTIKEN